MPDQPMPSAHTGAFPRPFGSKYILLNHLATGGMADVFLARLAGPAGFVKECVIKRILPHLSRSKEFVDMFLDEARLCARLNHPNIAQVYDLGRVGDDYFIAMEHVHGVDLGRVFDNLHEIGEHRLPYSLAARVVAAVADGLEHAHNAVDALGRPLGIVHRDVTPSNIMINFDGVPKLLDFGIARATARNGATEVGVIKGKAPYMSPEQVQAEPLDGRSDLFSLATILYELTCGDTLWKGESAAQVAIRILHDEPTPPTLIVNGYPEELEEIVLAALAKKPTDRTATARAFQVQLERYLMASGEHITAHDVAEYLAAHFPDERDTLQRLTSELNVLATSDTMLGQRAEPSGPVSIGDTAVVQALANEEAPPVRTSSGAVWIAAGLVVAALIVVGGLLLMRQKPVATAAAAPVVAPAAAPVLPSPNAAAPTSPSVAPNAPAQPTATPSASAGPSATAAPAGLPSDELHPPEAKVPPKKKPTPLRALPHLPVPPPPDE